MEDHSINIFSRNNIGKKFVYHGDILEDLSNGDVFEVTEYKSDDIHQIGYGASLVSLVKILVSVVCKPVATVKPLPKSYHPRHLTG